MTSMRIGIDFDNTIASYNNVFAMAAKKLGFLVSGTKSDKNAIKKALLSNENGEEDWMRVQGQVYGAFMDKAEIFPGFQEFLNRATGADVELMIISHKTEYGHFDPAQINLRHAARAWLSDQGISGSADAPVPEANVYFESTREEKIARIAELRCTHFVDDLEDVLSHQDFPSQTRRFLFSPGDIAEPKGDIVVCATWPDLEDHVFGVEH